MNRRTGTILAFSCLGIIGIVITALLITGGVFLSRTVGDMQEAAKLLPSEKQAAIQEGLALTAKDLERVPPVPDSQNAAPLYRKITAMIKAKENQYEKQLQHDAVNAIKQPDDPVGAAKIKEFMKLHEKAVELGIRAAQMPDCDFKRNWALGTNIQFPEYAQMRTLANLLVMRSEAQAKAGDFKGAFQSLTYCGRIGRHTGTDPLLISMLVQSAIESIAHKQWVSLVKRYGQNEEVLRLAEKTSLKIGDIPNLELSLRGECCISDITIQMLREGKFTQSDISRAVKKQGSNPWVIDAFETRTIQYWREATSEEKAAHGDLLQLHQAQQKIQQKYENNRFKPSYVLQSILSPVFANATLKVLRLEAQNQLRQTMLNLLRYRNQTGHFPTALSELKQPGPEDPFTRKPLLYKQEGAGFVLYSVGEDQKDDGGIDDGKTKAKDIIVRCP